MMKASAVTMPQPEIAASSCAFEGLEAVETLAGDCICTCRVGLAAQLDALTLSSRCLGKPREAEGDSVGRGLAPAGSRRSSSLQQAAADPL